MTEYHYICPIALQNPSNTINHVKSKSGQLSGAPTGNDSNGGDSMKSLPSNIGGMNESGNNGDNMSQLQVEEQELSPQRIIG